MPKVQVTLEQYYADATIPDVLWCAEIEGGDGEGYGTLEELILYFASGSEPVPNIFGVTKRIEHKLPTAEYFLGRFFEEYDLPAELYQEVESAKAVELMQSFFDVWEKAFPLVTHGLDDKRELVLTDDEIAVLVEDCKKYNPEDFKS